MAHNPRLAFLGGATVYQGVRRVEVSATMFAEGDSPASSFFGHYDAFDGAEPLESGEARIRFSDGSEADTELAAVDPDRGGFRISGYLESTEEVMRAIRRSSEPSSSKE